jgi:hypothetical protein
MEPPAISGRFQSLVGMAIAAIAATIRIAAVVTKML